MSLARIKCGNKTEVRVTQLTESLAPGNQHWKANNRVTRAYFPTQQGLIECTSAGNNCNASNNVPIFFEGRQNNIQQTLVLWVS